MCPASGNCVGYAAKDASGKLEPWRFDRREGTILSGYVDCMGIESRGREGNGSDGCLP